MEKILDYQQYLLDLPKETYITILENCYSEITVANTDGDVIYANPKSIECHGILPENMRDINFLTSYNGLWTPPSTQYAIDTGRTVFCRQKYLLDKKLHITITTPVYDENNELEMIVYTSMDDDAIQHFDIDYLEESGSNKISAREKQKSDNNIVGNSYIIYKTLNRLYQAAKSDIPVLLLGETGVGKSLFAKYIHDCSPRKDAPFISINCASIPDNLIESELFGYVPYAFTGASPKGKKGLVELANGGTLFLDEIGELEWNIQVKLLDFLENQRFISVGGLEQKYVDTRIVTATNKNIDKQVEKGVFREDLFWRINGITQTIPPLRERSSDIIPLLKYFLSLHNKKYNKNKQFSDDVLKLLMSYSWPGNVRQLRSAVEYMAAMSIGNMIETDHLPEQVAKYVDMEILKNGESLYNVLLESYKKKIVINYYNEAKNVKTFADTLGISQANAYRLINTYVNDG